MRESFTIMAAGAILGIPSALAATRLVKSLLFGLEPWDYQTLVYALAALLAAGALASYLPARRAAAVEPIAALRNE
jgi:ABC-type antimicrobial peptide transport system permease subunit